jgi:hypothetical protein
MPVPTIATGDGGIEARIDIDPAQADHAERFSDDIDAPDRFPEADLEAELGRIADETLSALPELERAIAVSSPIDSLNEHRIFFASNVLEVMLNLRQWNVELQTAEGKAQWGKRTVTFFVFDPNTGQFAPSKYCAFVPIHIRESSGVTEGNSLMMDTRTYAALDETETRFDGAIARKHLCRRLSFYEQPLESVSTEIKKAFDIWAGTHSKSIRIHPRGAAILRPADWWM